MGSVLSVRWWSGDCCCWSNKALWCSLVTIRSQEVQSQDQTSFLISVAVYGIVECSKWWQAVQRMRPRGSGVHLPDLHNKNTILLITTIHSRHYNTVHQSRTIILICGYLLCLRRLGMGTPS